mmetsp:Transcript_18060/g.37881  ORF Transcript_18060/g.37881 Transcript_18060/m.37881 type:complete len:298 (+) Transcript_18060:303-1196(+)
MWSAGVSNPFISSVKLLRSQSVNNDLRLQVPDLDALIGGSTQPVPVGRKDERVDNFTCIETVETLSLVEIPEHGSSVFSSRRTERTIGRDANGVEVTGVSNKVVAEFAVGQRPDLDKSVPSARDDEGNALRRTETNAGDPLGVSFGIVSDGVFALSEGVPKLDGLITSTTDDLTVVNTEGNTQDILRVSDETTGSASGIDLPKAESSVPGSGECELSITGDDDVADEMAVSAEGALGVAVRVIFAGAGVSEAPDQDGFVARCGQDEVGILGGGGDGGHPVGVAPQASTEAKSFAHGC